MSQPVAIEPAVKTCSKCGETKPLSEFHRNKSAPDGHRWDCKECTLAQTKAAQAALRERMGEDYYLAHKAETVRRHRAKGRDVRAKESNRAYNEALHQLRRRHQAEFDALLRLERHKRGLP